MDQVTTKDMKAALNAVADMIEEKKDWLCELDGVIGDADHGVTMSVGFKAVRTALADVADEAPLTEVFNSSAKALLNAMGGSAGPLFATAFMRAGASAKGKEVLTATDMAALIEAMADGIAARGKSEAGEKTMLDAWLPAKQAALAAKDDSLSKVLTDAAAAAKQGAQDTIAMVASKGRSSRLGERSKGHMDPGAASAAEILQTLADQFS